MADDDHNTSNALLLLCAHALVAPVLLSGMTEADELVVALTCLFALDVFTIIQQDYSAAAQDSTLSDFEPSARVDVDAPPLGPLADRP